MVRYKYIFAVVTYRNCDDIKEFIESTEKEVNASFKIIIVNNYYDELTNRMIKDIALQNDCDFIEADNKGYGHGNNIAIEYAREHYLFDYLVISNPDIVIKRFNDIKLSELEGIIAPNIINRANKIQNPMEYKDSKLAAKCVYKGLKNNNIFIFAVGLLIKRINRLLGYALMKVNKKNIFPIYMAHGSFLIIDSNTLSLLEPLYDDSIFLFAEENYLAIRAKKMNIKTFYFNDIEVFHKEDGSMKFQNDINSILIESNVYVYEKYYL